jgi:hypothetical protein
MADITSFTVEDLAGTSISPAHGVAMERLNEVITQVNTNTSDIGGETVEDVDLYVDPTGSDTLGDGSASKPYATIDKAYSAVPKQVNHTVHIRVAAGTYSSFPNEIDNKYGPNGQLTIDGGEPTVDSGPHVITGLTNYGPFAVMQDITVAAAGWTPDEFKNKFLKITVGVWPESMHHIISNTTDTIRIGAPQYAIVNGETFTVVEPPVTVNVGAGEKISVTGYNKASPKIPRLGIGSINFVGTSGEFVADQAAACFPLCIFNLGTGAGKFQLKDSVISPDSNFGGMWIDQANSFDNIMSTYPGYHPFNVICSNGATDEFECILKNTVVRGIYVDGKILAIEEGSNGVHLSYGRARNVDWRVDGFITQLACDGGSGDVMVFGTRGAVGVFLSSTHVEEGSNAIYIWPSSSIMAYSISTTSANITGHALKVDAFGTYMNKQNANPTGTTGDIQFFLGTPSTVAWPAAGAVATDSKGAFVSTV